VADPWGDRPWLARGSVRHRRLRPVDHAFEYPTWFLLLPMRRLAREPWPALRRNRRGWMSFADRDHGDGGPDALAWAEDLLAREGVHDADGELWLQTYPRLLGFVFKPVSFWYALRADGSLAAVLAEVNNTFGERHVYLLRGPELAWGRDCAAQKVFHVSPFCRVEGHYRFRFGRSPDRAVSRVELDDGDGPLLQTALGGRLAPATAAALRRAVLGSPLMTMGVIAHIHWQALKLWWRRVPVHDKPAQPPPLVSRSS